MEKTFAFEDLEVWQKAVGFADEVIAASEHLDTDQRHYRLVDQLEAAVTSVPMNIAEGKGRYSKKEFVQFLYIARGSLYETATLLTIFKKRGWIDQAEYNQLSDEAMEINRMLMGLIHSINS